MHSFTQVRMYACICYGVNTGVLLNLAELHCILFVYKGTGNQKRKPNPVFECHLMSSCQMLSNKS